MTATNYEKKIEYSSGMVRYVDHMGDDYSSVQAARVSYSSGTKTVQSDDALIRYLLNHKHLSPFEMANLKVHIRCPLYIAAQVMRHRTFAYNMMSARYSVMDVGYYIPDYMPTQSDLNKQGRSEVDTGSHTRELYIKATEFSDQSYSQLLEANVTRELARGILPCGTLTEFYMAGNLRNWLDFLSLRLPKNAQVEVRDLANGVAEMIKDLFPVTYQAYVDYSLEAKTFSREEMVVLKQLMCESMIDRLLDTSPMTKREKQEFRDKLK